MDACEFEGTDHLHQRGGDVDDDDEMRSSSSTFLSNRRHQQSLFLFPPPNQAQPTRSSPSSVPSTAASTPLPSRSTSPLPSFYHPPNSTQSSSCPSDSDSEERTFLLGRSENSGSSSTRTWRQNTLANRRPWWSVSSPRRRRQHGWRITRQLKRILRKTILHPICAIQPLTIVLILILFSLFAIALTLLIMYILNPDKEPLPWRAYCSVPSLFPPFDKPVSSDSPRIYPNTTAGEMVPRFPPPGLEELPPVGVFAGVFTTDNAFERRQLIRTTWASHPRSREGAGVGDNGTGTSRTIVRFIMGQPRKDWERRVKLEMETYKDIIMLPVAENMNHGKTHTFFSWAAINAFVPPVYNPSSRLPSPEFSYSNSTSTPPPLAPHDPLLAWDDVLTSAKDDEKASPWVRPDYVVKLDDDSFVMLAELEARLRWELHQWPQKKQTDEKSGEDAGDDDELPEDGQDSLTTVTRRSSRSTLRTSATSFAKAISTAGATASRLLNDVLTPFEAPSSSLSSSLSSSSRTLSLQNQFNDPLIYWGYLIYNRHSFMAGELYAVSWSLVDWIAQDATVKTMKKGPEDQQTARWMKIHPRASEVRWVSEKCWIYNHPRSGTVYTHGFLFPSEVTRVRNQVAEDLEKSKVKRGTTYSPPASLSDDSVSNIGGSSLNPSSWAHSSVSTFGVRYTPPLPDLSTIHSVEALVEGSPMSHLREGTPMSPDHAWKHREGRRTRYEDKRVGGTVVVHYIKKNMWFLETAMALLHDREVSESEEYEEERRKAIERDGLERKKTVGVNMRSRNRHLQKLIVQEQAKLAESPVAQLEEEDVVSSEPGSSE
ncbi:hypothetical protein CPB83DRAFT_13074 [Crepidotus variabilis]|uniref:Glycosyltransferase family 31 protein n=1 Tax=Crepidotus variabilis TaxID=179855 RepID=A0A9P6EV32_9AGAR|nr:hypothetical protein CPB83DRAFT_13074 [Crepidotus variabilis]